VEHLLVSRQPTTSTYGGRSGNSVIKIDEDSCLCKFMRVINFVAPLEMSRIVAIASEIQSVGNAF
jgi:hypothetical protein